MDRIVRDERTRNVVLVLVSVGLMLFARHAPEPMADFLRRHGANLAASFGAFFLVRLFRLPGVRHAWVSAAYAFAAVALVEVAQETGHYPGTFDPMDLAWNATGVGAAWLVHALTSRRNDG